ncbi:hypothetical protein K2173_003974 [Erythroxylum novogranatense]|uniref:Uncharacterized protein n=1 Tax=Erythroxylum novogranatense TaxID=1862640 RepID=A0AAV8SJE5_9ROSI|nr:hypothetical protein K2173_003974 [Erythroxylum novogranatense]
MCGKLEYENPSTQMEDSSTILCQISVLKGLLDQVNEEIEANILITQEIESEIVKCTEMEAALVARESELTKTIYVSHFEINGLISVACDSRKHVKLMEEELSCLRTKREEMLKKIGDKRYWREQFIHLCLDFQRDIGEEGNKELTCLLSEKEFLENEVHMLDEKNNSRENLMLAFMEDVLQEFDNSNSAL